MGEGPTMEIKPAKGRPMLTWVGKRPLRHVTAFPAQHVETFGPTGDASTPDGTFWEDWPAYYPKGGLLFHGDNKEVLAHLLANGFRGKVKLVYIDPPFDSGADYVRKVSLRGVSGTAKLDGEGYALGEQLQYTDIWANDNYLQFMYERLLLLKELLAEDGGIYLHCDWHKSHHLRCVMDEVFGDEHIVNEIIWKRTSARSDSSTFNHIHDTILFYSKGKDFHFKRLTVPHDPGYIAKYYTYSEPDGRIFATIDATQSGLRSGPSGQPWRGFNPASKGNHWKFSPEELERLDAEGRIYWPEKEDGWPRLKSYLDEAKGAAIQTIWSDIKAVNSQADERGSYPTQKPEALLERIIRASSDPGHIVLDCFIGSGTTAAVAQKLGRRWIGCDINKGAIQTTSKRLQTIIRDQVEAVKKRTLQPPLPETEAGESVEDVAPAQLSFNVYRVNDYDLQIQHNEAVNLVCDHIGVTRTRTDSYFDGVRGNQLVKIVPFSHPLSVVDLEELKNELQARLDESRDILVVCLGKELAADAWLDEWNRLRLPGRVVNRIEVIELRTDPKYGKFIDHKPACAKVSIRRVNGNLVVEVEDFISPTIIERLKQQNGLLQPQITDWRSMVDSVMIDVAFDGQAFRVAYSDVPEKKSDLVAGTYELVAPEGETVVAVKLTDMLGEEVLVIQQV